MDQTIGLLSPSRLTRFARGGTGVTGAETAGMATIESVARHGSFPCRLYAPRQDAASIRGELKSLQAASKRDVYPMADLALHFGAGDLSAVHTHATDLGALAALRARRSPCLVPLTAMQYSVCQMEVHLGTFLPYLMADLYPCDAAICTTQIAREAQLRILERIHEALRGRGLDAPLTLRHEVIPYPIDTEYFRPPSPDEKRSARQSLGLPLSGRIVLYVGRFDPATKSDLQPLLLAFRAAHKRLGAPDDLALVLAGYDSTGRIPMLRRTAEEYGIGDKVHFHTEYPPAQQVLYYQAADLFVSLSDTLQENFGLTPVEAMSCGLPAVVSDWGGYRETVVEGETGFRLRTIWAPREEDMAGLAGLLPWPETQLPLSQAILIDPMEAADRIATLLENEELRLKMGQAARARVEREYAAPGVVARMAALWAELSESANSMERRPCPRAGLYDPNFSQEMASYAAGRLPGDARLLLTDYGREVLGGSVALPLPEDHEPFYPRDATLGLLGTLKAGSLMNRGLPRLDVSGQGARKFGLSEPAADRCLLWLV